MTLSLLGWLVWQLAIRALLALAYALVLTLCLMGAGIILNGVFS